MRLNVPQLRKTYYNQPAAGKLVSFGTSGHRGSPLHGSFNELHIIATSQAIVDYRRENKIDGPLFLGFDTHAISRNAFETALRVFASNGITVFIQKNFDYTPTPVVSHAILAHNKGRTSKLADGVIITPSHNPPEDGGFKYNPPNGGPADVKETSWIQTRANEYLANEYQGIQVVDFDAAADAKSTIHHDYIQPYVDDLGIVVDMQAIKDAGIKIGVDPMGGAGVHFWEPIVERYGLNIEVVNPKVDPTFSFMRVDKDGKIRMDCSSPWAMAGLVDLKDRFDIAVGNDTDYDRHGIVDEKGLMNPNHYLSVAIWYLFQNREGWGQGVGIGKTLVSSSMIDRVARHLNRRLVEVPVGFKWFVEGLGNGTLGFGGEESAGASFLRMDGSTWVTEKDGFIMDLLAAEMMAKTGFRPSEIYADLTRKFGDPVYERIDAPATPEQKAKLKALSPDMIKAEKLAGEPIQAILTEAPGNNARIGGLKIVSENGWVAMRPSGTEDIYKIYAESFKGEDHLRLIQAEGQEIVSNVLK